MLERVRNHLILNSSSVSDLGLYHGKMGIVLFFFHYAKHQKACIYEEFAWELLNEITNNISESLQWNMEHGLIGIMWGIEYLYQNGFLEGDSDVALYDLEQKIFEMSGLHLLNNSLGTGLSGLASYLQYRIDGKQKKRNYNVNGLHNRILNKIRNRCSIYHETDFLYTICDCSKLGSNMSNWELGLYNGCAGYGLKAMKVI